MDANEARARYDEVFARYSDVRSRLEDGDTTAGLAEEAQRLYEQSMATYAELTAAITGGSDPALVTGVPLSGETSAPADAVTARAAGEVDLSRQPVAAEREGLATTAPATAADTTVLGRRNGLRRFSPPPEQAPSEQPLRRDVLTVLRTDKRSEIGRERKIAGNLPDWDLLPPGEIVTVVRR